jgi:hypothetical protein
MHFYSSHPYLNSYTYLQDFVDTDGRVFTMSIPARLVGDEEEEKGYQEQVLNRLREKDGLDVDDDHGNIGHTMMGKKVRIGIIK